MPLVENHCSRSSMFAHERLRKYPFEASNFKLWLCPSLELELGPLVPQQPLEALAQHQLPPEAHVSRTSSLTYEDVVFLSLYFLICEQGRVNEASSYRCHGTTALSMMLSKKGTRSRKCSKTLLFCYSTSSFLQQMMTRHLGWARHCAELGDGS